MKNVKQIAIFSVIILLLILTCVGLTYAFIRVRIISNTLKTSVTVSSEVLEISYLDGTAYFVPNGSNLDEGSQAIDGYEVNRIEPGDQFVKDFTVSNDGDAPVIYGVFLDELINTFARTEDITYTLTCTSNQGTCTGVTDSNPPSFPTENSLIVSNLISDGETQTYRLTVSYAYLDEVNQSEDMGKKLAARLQIHGSSDVAAFYGTIANASTGDYLELKAPALTSQIVNNTFKFVGIEPGEYTLYLKDSNGTIKAQMNITINRGEITNIETGNILTINEDHQTINAQITYSNSNLSATYTIE